MFAAVTTEAFFVVRDVNWDLFLDIHRVRDRDGLRDVNWVGFGHFNMVRHGVWYFDGDLNFIRHLLLYRVWYFLLHHNGVGFGYLHRVRLGDSHVDRNLNFIRDFLLDCDCVGLRDRIRHLLCDYNGSHVLLMVLLFITAFQNPTAVTVLFKTPLLQFSHTKSQQHPQKCAHLSHNNSIQNADGKTVAREMEKPH
jgi:hypothetical protein